MNGWCGVKDCNQPQLDNMPICENHAFDIWVEVGFRRMDISKAGAAHMRNQDIQKARTELIREKMGVEQYMAERRQAPGTIYYVLIADQIKIGFTTDLETRMKGYPPMAKVLATHPGTRETERQMHDKFAAHLAGGREWFAAHDEIHEHIEQVRQQFPQAA